ncbi:serine/arginine repetitive matrix protein 1-like [Stylophora pistillata]|uniref:Storkhead-box protein 1 n=1 Tax=Stylophora pistillata TaxID=50429 RepID=A0A2B4RET8_STYPI|nr:serine/arginine repetitive matrix protein 1-like [Stylophora pistillata]PFX16894.1 Storkhead-box protein 1 [Stylophora pistillata]
MSSNIKSMRDRTPKCSIVLSNVLAIVFRPTSTVHNCENIRKDDSSESGDSKPSHQLNGLELFHEFKEANRSTMLTRLTESLGEIRLKGWVFPFTLLIKGPHEDVEVIKEAWRRHFLRSPDNFIIKDIGAVSSVGMEVIQQAPFLPLTKSLVETIAALNSSQLTATQQSIAEYLARTYQYVHVPKLNVIHDCLGILIKERRIYHTGNGYFVNGHNPFNKPTDAPKENGEAQSVKDSKCVACEVISKGKSTKNEKTKKRGKGKVEGDVKEKEKENEKIREGVKLERKTSVSNTETEETRDVKSLTPQTKEETTKPLSETASETSSEGTNKKPKKQKKGVLNQISCFIKGKTLSSAEVSEDAKQEPNTPLPTPPFQVSERQAPLAAPENMSPYLIRNEKSVTPQLRHVRTMSAPVGHSSLSVPPQKLQESNEREIKTPTPNLRELGRSKSFSATEKRPQLVMRSNSFTAPSTATRVARQISTVDAPVTWDRPRPRINYGDIIRNAPGRRTIHISQPNSYNMGIIRPVDMTQQRPLSRNSSITREIPRKIEGSLSSSNVPRSFASPLSAPRLKENSNHARVPVMRSKSFTEPGITRLANRQFSHRQTMGSHYESPLQQLLARKTPGYTSPPSTVVRVTAAPKGVRYHVPVKHSPASLKRATPSTSARKQQKQPSALPKSGTPREKPRPRTHFSSPISYDTNKLDDKGNNSLCNGNINNAGGEAKSQAPVFQPNYNFQQACAPSDGVSSEHICLEEMSSTSASEVTLIEERDWCTETRNDNEGKPQNLYKKFTEETVNDSLTFIGII